MLRDHLAANDRRLVFLFGAGTSCSINTAPMPGPGEPRDFAPLVPTIFGLTTHCEAAVSALSADHLAAWTALVTECEAMGLPAHIETILSRVRHKLAAAGPTDMALGLDADGIRALEAKICDTIALHVSPEETAIPESTPHERFARWVRHARRRHPIEVFTTNYDVLIERSLERAHVPIFDGFVGSYEPFFSPEMIEMDDSLPGATWTRLWKLHGSINWAARHGGIVRVSSNASGEMILPSQQKYDESRKLPYLALMDRLSRCLSEDGALLVTCGYSWNDEHINAVVLGALANHPASHAIALAYEPLAELPRLTSLALHHDNLIVAGPRSGVINRMAAPWELPSGLTRARASVVDPFFDSDAVPDQEAGPIPGRLRLGDFNVLAEFLESMGRVQDRTP